MEHSAFVGVDVAKDHLHVHIRPIELGSSPDQSR